MANNVELFLRYLQDRPIVLKLIDVSLIAVVVLTIGATYIVAMNFNNLFMNGAQIEYERFINAAETNQKINTILTTMREETGAARIGIFQFHNGTTGIGDLPFFYYTQTFEAIAPGMSSELQNNQRISMTVDPDIIVLKETHFGTYREIEPSTPFGHMLVNRGVTQMFRHAIYSITGEFVGFLTLEFVIPTNMSDEKIKGTLARYAGAISGYLTH